MNACVGEGVYEWVNKRIYFLVGGLFFGDFDCDRREEGKEGGMGCGLFFYFINIYSFGFWGFNSNKIGIVFVF